MSARGSGINRDERDADLVERLRSDGYARLRLLPDEEALLSDLHTEARNFFASPDSAKRQHMRGDFNFGFRPYGRQYSITPERPDMNESFAYWADDPTLIEKSEEIQSFISALRNYWALVESVAQGVIAECARRLNAAPTALDLRTSSYIEINSYIEAPDRELLQDRHEDGHLLTILNATGPGLEVEVSEHMEPVGFTSSDLVLMPGSLLTDLTGGWIPPLFHQVRNHGLAERQSILFLVNPSTGAPLAPFRVTEENAGVDIAERARINGHAFGLPDAPLPASDE